ncbi:MULTISPECIES: hypothetical protein [unclassified Colwellia]|uniref:hypothetical protein n=1 Tax=unclassified Colwellia TaxID=196834 RepID=UPI0015F6D313|nr:MULTISPECIES: hypothetical protein [unclassified Colwellia]MBA6225706.1 hypothetical protein [Colwellia sp. MB3u-45]MBA6266954.1 hypothetical protein [Colwellia sp. MB3u-43]MBA6290546.1 hypothetical protein [Colwellia sp. MB3u-4]MBA6295476.1 hypothetical protein [Colwellia sp. MB02u-9]MBA6321866.1 hypothetical protein [Colwellia sp. MB02u-19]
MKNNSIITLTILTLLSLTTKAETLNVSLAQCLKIQDSLARLVCFDDLAEQAVPAVNVKAKMVKNTPEVKDETTMAPTSTKVADFGAEHLTTYKVAEEDQQVVLIVEQLSKDHYDKWRFTFTNGQQWQQTDNDFLKIEVGDSVLLKKGFMSAVYLKKNLPDSNRKIRVKRMK